VGSENGLSRERARGEVFRLLSACLCEPEKDAFLQEEVFDHLGRAVGRVCPGAEAPAREMKAAFSAETEEALRVEHARLFVGPHELPAPPYGSVYLEKGRMVMGRSTVDVVAFYRTEGIHVDEEAAELPDHIAVELEFVHHLIARELAEVEAGNGEAATGLRQKQEAFLRQYVLPWAPRWCADVLSHTESGYYASLARLLQDLMERPECLLPDPDTEGPAPGLGAG
jgi:TorA maturation chaperone TorD